ncbi:MAG: hypothetical protein QM817_32335 [Archangium sp.]
MRIPLLLLVVGSVAWAENPATTAALTLERAGNDAQTKCDVALMRAKQFEAVDAKAALQSAREAVEAGSPMRDEFDASFTVAKNPGSDFGTPLIASRLSRLRGKLFECVRDAELINVRLLKSQASSSPDARKQAIGAAETFLQRYAADKTAADVKKWLAELKTP